MFENLKPVFYPNLLSCQTNQNLQEQAKAVYSAMFFEKNGILMMPVLHPAALLRNPNNKPAAFEDFLRLQEKIREICDHTY